MERAVLRGGWEGFQLSQTSLLYSHADGGAAAPRRPWHRAFGFAGALSTPGTVTLTVRKPPGETGNTANIATLTVAVTAATVFGDRLREHDRHVRR